jgi:hypothetical protein
VAGAEAAQLEVGTRARAELMLREVLDKLAGLTQIGFHTRAVQLGPAFICGLREGRRLVMECHEDSVVVNMRCVRIVCGFRHSLRCCGD